LERKFKIFKHRDGTLFIYQKELFTGTNSSVATTFKGKHCSGTPSKFVLKVCHYIKKASYFKN
jgi:hypothetical protein